MIRDVVLWRLLRVSVLAFIGDPWLLPMVLRVWLNLFLAAVNA